MLVGFVKKTSFTYLQTGHMHNWKAGNAGEGAVGERGGGTGLTAWLGPDRKCSGNFGNSATRGGAMIGQESTCLHVLPMSLLDGVTIAPRSLGGYDESRGLRV